MANEPTTTTSPNGAPPAADPAATAPAASSEGAATETPPAQAAQTNGTSQVKVGQGRPNGKRKEIRIPEGAFKARVEREAIAIVKRKLGVSLEEAEQIIKAGGSPTAGNGTTEGAAAATADQALDRYRSENEKLKRQVEANKKSAVDWEKKHKKDTQRLRDQIVEAKLQASAAQVGVLDTDYALHLFAKEVAKNDKAEPKEFFSKLKETHPFLFTAGVQAAPIPVAPTTAPPESTQPGEVKPTPTASTPSTAGPAVEDMSPSQFANHSRNVYGFTPGM